MDYFILKYDRALEDGVVIDAVPINGPKGYLYKKFEPLIKTYPRRAEIHYSTRYPNGTILYDFFDNINGIFVVSDRVKKVVESYQKEAVEFLPVQVFDHEKKMVETVIYYIVNFYEDVDWIDMQNSSYEIDSLRKNEIFEIYGDVHILSENIPENYHFFRSVKWPETYVVSEELANAMNDAGIIGYELQKTYSPGY